MGVKATIKRIWRDPAGEGLVLLLITGIAALLRLTAIGTMPPGLYHDEAYNGLDALGVLGGRTPIFFGANNGREPLFIYLLAAGVGLWGRSPGALRLVSALLGTLTIPAIYWLGRELFDREVATLAALLALTTVWMLNLSRVAFRAVAMPPLMALSLALLWRGLRQRRLGPLACAGLFYGLSFYTYLAARFSLVSLFFFIVYNWLQGKDAFWTSGWALFGLLSLVVIAPLGLYFAGHCQDTLGRAAQVSIFNPAIHGGHPWGTLLRHTWHTLRGFFYRGDFIPRHNVPLRPVFTPLVGLAFLGGVGLSIRRSRRWPAYGLCLIWLGTMLLPTILAEDAPHMLRGSGILPVLFLFPALGLVELRRWAARAGLARVGSAMVGGILALGAARDVSDYARHLRSEAVYYNFEGGATELSAEVNRFLGIGWSGRSPIIPVTGRRAYIDAKLWRDWASLRYLCPDSEALEIWEQVGRVANPPPEKDILLVLWPYQDLEPALSLLPRDKVISLRRGAWERGDLEEHSRLLYVAFRSLSADAVPRNVDAVWEGDIRLLGYRLVPTGDDALLVELYWQAHQAVEASYTVFCHLLCQGEPIGQHDGLPAEGYYPTERWRLGDIVEDRHLARLTAPYDERTCEVEVGLYRRETMQRLALLDEGGQPTQRTSVSLH